MLVRTRRVATAALLSVALVSALAACSDGGGSDPESTGPAKQAVERLHDFGLDQDEARCIVDEVGADSVVEATDLNAFTGSQQYQDAAGKCIDGN